MMIFLWHLELLVALALSLHIPETETWRLLPRSQHLPLAKVGVPRQQSRFGRVQMESENGHSAQPKERVAVITGGTSQFGEAIAMGLAESNKYERVIIIGRNELKAERILEQLQRKSLQADFIKADLSCLEEVSAVCKRLQGTRLQCLVCAAGVTAIPERQETSDGYEYHFGLNFLSRFLMVNSLMEELSSAGTVDDPARVLLVGSDRHWGPPVLGFASLGKSLPLSMGNLNDMQLEGADAYGAWEAFGQAALCNVMFSYELQKRLRTSSSRNVAVSCVDPGPMETAWHRYRREENRVLAAGMSEAMKNLYKYFTRLIEKPEVAAKAFVLLATTSLGILPCNPVLGNFGCYFAREFPVPSKYPVPWSWGTSYDEAVWAQLWQYAEALTEKQESSLGATMASGFEDAVKLPQIRPVYAWHWFWWHAPRPLALALADTLLWARA